jgi:HSP20 family protein
MDLMNDWLMMPRMFDWADPLRRVATDALRVEEFEKDGELVVRAEMPGIDPQKDVEITMTNHTLCIKAERHQESSVADNDTYRSEFRYGSFMRSVELPAGATEHDVKASYEKGILEVHVPIEVSHPATRIPVSAR